MLKRGAKKFLKQVIPDSHHSKLREQFNRVKYFGTARYCPICDTHARKFRPFGTHGNLRPDASCPFCGSLERHRLVWAFLRNHTDLFDKSTATRMLHVAPGPFEETLREEESIKYLSGDIDEDKAMERLDVTDIQYSDGTFDAIYASHVLEHVPDDRKAMSELHRVLAPEGWAVLQVPITAEETFEDSSVTDPEERVRLFGQHNHVRRYGPDYKDRLEATGFDVTLYSASEVVGEKNVQRMGVSGTIYYCEEGSS